MVDSIIILVNNCLYAGAVTTPSVFTHRLASQYNTLWLDGNGIQLQNNECNDGAALFGSIR